MVNKAVVRLMVGHDDLKRSFPILTTLRYGEGFTAGWREMGANCREVLKIPLSSLFTFFHFQKNIWFLSCTPLMIWGLYKYTAQRQSVVQRRKHHRELQSPFCLTGEQGTNPSHLLCVETALGQRGTRTPVTAKWVTESQNG